MPCPYFEPQRVMAEPTHCNARLPLIDEFDGVCRALGATSPVPPGARLSLCNHGNARGLCVHFPASEQRSSFRFQVLSRSTTGLELLFIEEALYAPVAWRRITVQMDSGMLEPDPLDACQRAQILAFCRSYLRRYPA
jgi:hypothetical protein